MCIEVVGYESRLWRKQGEAPVCYLLFIAIFKREDCRGEIGELSLLWESPLHASWTWAANCKFQSTSSIEGLSAGSLSKHLQHISIIVFTDSPEHVFLTAGSTKLFVDAPSVTMPDCNCIASCKECTDKEVMNSLSGQKLFCFHPFYFSALKWRAVNKILPDHLPPPLHSWNLLSSLRRLLIRLLQSHIYPTYLDALPC